MLENQPISNLQKNKGVLITGGSGLIGKYLTSLLLSEGYNVSHLSRRSGNFGKVRVFRWDPKKGILDPAVFEVVGSIVHLAGANIGEMRWTKKRKQEIESSRIDYIKLLHKTVSENEIKLKAFISASAIGYYGSVTSDKIFKEDDPPAIDFLGKTCKLWEDEAALFQNIGVRTVKIRTAVVLEKNHSPLSKFTMPAKFGFLVQAGTGRQYIPWIHINDLCNIYLKAIEDSDMSGSFNAVSPQHVTHKDFMRILALVMKRHVFPIPVPAFILKAALGEMSEIVLKGSRVAADKIINSGYKFHFPDLSVALEDILLQSGL
jgi:uncharacterized protein